MRHCPTCGQTILPSMGETIARKVDQAQAQGAQTPNIRTQRQAEHVPQAADNVHLSLKVGANSPVSLRAETTPRGFKAQHLVNVKGKRYRIRLLFITFPNRGTLGCKTTVIELGKERKVTPYDLAEHLSTHPHPPYSHEWQANVDMDGPLPITISLRAS